MTTMTLLTLLASLATLATLAPLASCQSLESTVVSGGGPVPKTQDRGVLQTLFEAFFTRCAHLYLTSTSCNHVTSGSG